MGRYGGPTFITNNGDTSWMAHARCRGDDVDRSVFFPEIDDEVSTNQQVAIAKAVCATCVVKGECLNYAQRNREQYGVWGGLAPKERQRLRSGQSTAVERDCAECHTPFTYIRPYGAGGKKLYCSKACQKRRSKRERRRQRKDGAS